MASFGETFRTEAIEANGAVIFRTVSGWRFGLSYGFPRTPTRAEYDHVKSGRGSAYANKTTRPNLPATYEEFVEQFETQCELLKARGVTDKTWALSASLWPRGRSSTKRDWEYLGEMLAALNVPLMSCKTPFDTTHPNDVHYWIWDEEDEKTMETAND